MKGITVTSAAAAACCLAATSVSASLPSATTTGTFGMVKNHAFAGLNARGGSMGEFTIVIIVFIMNMCCVCDIKFYYCVNIIKACNLTCFVIHLY